MVQGRFSEELRSNRAIKRGDCLGHDVYLGGIGFGFTEEGFSRSKNLDPAMKAEMDDSVPGGRSLSCKRPKYHQQQQWSPVTSTEFTQCLSFNPLAEPSPLGLTLKKTPSFLDLIEMKLSEGDRAVPAAANNLHQDAWENKDENTIAVQSATDKLKASNFPASLLKIGSWERISRYEGDLVAKCYYAKRKLVWEVLEGGLKSKIEIQWSDITSLKASYPDNRPGTLEIEISRAPMFCRETNPQPRKHTLWQPTSDFTGGQASICRRHILQFNQGILEKHFEKLIQCDHRLNLLSKEGIMTKDSPYFDSSDTIFQAQEEHNCYGVLQEHKSHLIPHIDHLNYLPPFSSLSDRATMVPMLVPKVESVEADSRVLEAVPQERPSPSSVMDLCAIDESGTSDSDDLHINTRQWEQLRFTAPFGGLQNQGSGSLSSVMDLRAIDESGTSDSDDLHINTRQWEQLRFMAPFGGLQNQGSGSLSSKSMRTLANQIRSCFPKHDCSHNLLPAGEDTCQANKKILYDIAQHLLSDSLVSLTSDDQKAMTNVNSTSSPVQKDISAANRFPINAKSIESSQVGYGLGRLEKGEVDGNVCQTNDDTTIALLNRGIRTGSHSNRIDDGHMYCQQATGISRQESLGDLFVNVPGDASLSPLFVDCSDEIMGRDEQSGEIRWNHFR
ncbi:hypothetical protein SUGI_0385690 [Cryptomeria japonica]|uniref:uncharacterized protein LOC131063968 n=1 Tax=Cryptomeria japonica TaxID=3369 RepID=UPI0024089FF7|nr:uncharacterized protein LOC131063968 [Cryptomeria japonica]XP_057854071.1 uncharacterized protein LOC131063968 [Cryptomeria japonica]GLJ21102.1 hypothetical protein SUGI_0385690 [Cryptomeria japonica]